MNANDRATMAVSRKGLTSLKPTERTAGRLAETSREAHSTGVRLLETRVLPFPFRRESEPLIRQPVATLDQEIKQRLEFVEQRAAPNGARPAIPVDHPCL